MDTKEFIASLVDSLAWPGAVVALVALLRSQLADLLGGSLRRLKLGPGGAELEWQEAVGAVATKVSPPPRQSATDHELGGVDEELDNLEALVEKTPSVALQQAFAVVERELARIVNERGVDLPPDDRRPDTLVKAAVKAGAITRETGEAVRGMVVLRNLAAHDPSGTRTTPQRAAEYLVLARAVLYSLERPLPPSALTSASSG